MANFLLHIASFLWTKYMATNGHKIGAVKRTVHNFSKQACSMKPIDFCLFGAHVASKQFQQTPT
jgi:hypothetical protein